MRGAILICLLVFCCPSYFGQLRICSWNLQNYGKSKTDSSVSFIARTLKGHDLVAIVEVVAGYGGTQAVARLCEALNRLGDKWQYVVSEPTKSTPGSAERYAVLWKPSVIQYADSSWLEQKYALEIEREPFYFSFKYKGTPLLLSVIHAIPRSKQPETELKYLKFIAAERSNQTMIFCGDFNCAESNNVFGPLKTMNFRPALTGQKTTLKSKKSGKEYLASEYDNIFYQAKRLRMVKSGIDPFYLQFPDLPAARKISDHVPVFCELEIK